MVVGEAINYCVPMQDLQSLFAVSIFMVAAVVAFFFMLGRLVSKSKWEGTARYEMRQAVISLILGIALFGLASVSCEISKYVLSNVLQPPSQFTDQFRHAEQYLNYLINEVGVPALKNFWVLSYTLSSTTATFRTTQGTKAFGIAAVIQKAIDKAIAPLTSIFVVSLNIQLLTVQAAQAFAFTMLLPIGLVLRAIPTTREGGSLLIALAFGLYVVWPFLFVADYEISKDIWPKLGLDKATFTTDFSDMSAPTLSGLFKQLWGIGSFLSILSPQATVLPILNLTILIAFVRIFADYINDLR